MEELGVHKPDADGMVRVVVDEETAKLIVQRGGRASARARVGRTVVASDPLVARLVVGSLYQFDLRVASSRDRQRRPSG
jgi:hypothetical protein